MFASVYGPAKPLIRYVLLVAFIALVSNSQAQTTYYVASNGSDNNDGRSVERPFQNLSRVNSLVLTAGDTVLFRRGDTFRGTLQIRRSGGSGKPINFDAYGSGSKPILAGSVPVSNWVNVGNNIWQSSCPTCGNAVTGLYQNGISLPLGRYPNADDPNKGNLTIRGHTQKYQIFSQEHLPTTIDWQGAEVVMRPTDWIIDRAVVDHQYGDALNLFNYSNYTPLDGSGYFFQNHPATLDRQGEWCYNSKTKSLQLYDTTGAVNNQILTATNSGRAVDIANCSYINLRNLQLTQTLNTTIYANNVSNLRMANLDITNSGEDGLTITGSGMNLLLENSNIVDVNNNGIQLSTYQNVTLRGNSLRNIGSITGRGKSGDGHYNGLQSAANNNVLIENNVIDNIGYNGISFNSNTTIRQNVISNFCITKVDGGGIYAWNGNKASMSNINIISNIIYTSPIVRGTSAYKDYSIGLFLDDCVENVTVRNNTIFGNTAWGVFLHAANHITFTDNTIFDNYNCQLVVYHNAGYCPIRGDEIKRNIIVSQDASQVAALYASNANDLLQYGTIDSNYYARPFNEEASILAVINSTEGNYYSLNEWKNFSDGHDLHSKNSPIIYNQYKNEGAGGTTVINNSFNDGKEGWELIYSRYGNGDTAQDSTNKIDGGSLRVGFTNSSGQSDSYAQVIKRIGTLTAGKTYVLRFDAIATINVNILVYLRQYGPPYQEYDKRYTASLSTTRKSFEVPFTATGSESDAIVLFQIDGEGPTFWLDNVRLQEDVPIRNNPDDFIKLFYNPTLRDSIITLKGNYRDVKNQLYSDSVILAPFNSIILLKDVAPLPPTDLGLFLESDKRFLQVNQTATFRLRISNQSINQAKLTRWACRLPANLAFIDSTGQAYSDNVLTGSFLQLAPQSDTVFSFLVKPTADGLFRVSAQITTATSPDTDSTPNSGVADGEDDTALVDLRVGNNATNVFESPNPNQRFLPSVVSNQPTPRSDQADLSLQMQANSRTPQVGKILTFTLSVNNGGGRTADGIQLENQLPDGFELVDTGGWTIVEGGYLRVSLAPIPSGSTQSISFQARVTLPGPWINRAQIKTSNVVDPDSTPGNGFMNGEDDQSQVDGRSQ